MFDDWQISRINQVLAALRTMELPRGYILSAHQVADHYNRTSDTDHITPVAVFDILILISKIGAYYGATKMVRMVHIEQTSDFHVSW